MMTSTVMRWKTVDETGRECSSFIRIAAFNVDRMSALTAATTGHDTLLLRQDGADGAAEGVASLFAP
jgi:hypothetical protein